MLLKIALALFAAWFVGLLLTNGGFIHLLLLVAIAVAGVHFARRHRCGEPLLSFNPQRHRA